MNRSPESKHHATSRLIFSLLVLFVAAIILLYRQDIVDRITVWQYQPSSDVAALAQRSTMNERGRYYFYASRPAVQDRGVFNRSCTTGQRSETTAVLGCYVSQRIFLFNVTDPQLDGIKEVTAAHEMLHAAYERLSGAERQRVDTLLDQQAQKITDPKFTALIAEYDKTEPGERLNELHSLIGTQVAGISPELEAYYSQYFTSRSSVVDLYTTYNTVFSQLQTQQSSLSAELEQLSTQITEEVTAYNKAAAQLETDIKTFNRKAESGAFNSEAVFTSERNALIARQGQLAATRDGLNVTISTFNTKRQQLAAINSQAEALNRSINSNLSPLPSI